MTPAQAPTAMLIDALADCLARRGRSTSRAVLAATLPVAGEGMEQGVVDALGALGIPAGWVAGSTPLADDLLPVIAWTDRGASSLIGVEEGEALLIAPGSDHVIRVPRGDIAQILLFAETAVADSRADEALPPERAHWFWPVLWRYRRYFAEAAALSGVVNILTLAGVIFMMTVYDRILPNLAYVTLWSLAIGVSLAALMELASRTVRGMVLDSAGKKIDLVLGDAVFGHVLAQRLERRGQSSGATANLLKEFESVRTFVTSASLTAVADLPFALLFIVVIAIVAGPLAFVPIVTFLIVGAASLLVQIPLARMARQGLREGAARHGILIESLEGIETLKTLRAESVMRRRHAAASTVIAANGAKSQHLSNFVTNLALTMQQLGGVVLLVWGVYRTGEGLASAGALVASVQLSSRALAPLLSLSGLALRLQAVRSAFRSLNAVMAQPAERDPGQTYLSRDGWTGAIELQQARFAYREDDRPALDDLNLRIGAGERIAILGRMGSGKSTLLRLLAALYRPQAGRVLLDGVDLASIDPADARAAVMLVGQDARLFHGSLADNLRLADRHADDDALLRAARLTGADQLATQHPRGYGRPIGERGDTLSGGQRQAVALARALLVKSSVLLLDEPTSAMDQRSEANVIEALRQNIGQRTLVIVTHKQQLLALADRVIVLDGGRIVADGPKAEIVAALAEGRIRTAETRR